MENRKYYFLVSLLLIVLAGSAIGLIQPGYASSKIDNRWQPTAFPTPTPRDNGQIVYIVQEGDSLWRIAALAQISIEELMALNGIQPDDFISPGMELLLGFAGPVEPTAAIVEEQDPQESPTPSPAPVFDTGEICVLLFVDENGNARLDEGEVPLPEGQVSVVEASGVLLGAHTTDLEEEGHCFPELNYGEYNISAAVPPDYIPTTVMNLPVSLTPGDIAYVQFGAQPNSSIVLINAERGGTSTVLGLVGLAFLGAAGALGYYATRMSRKSPRSLR